MERGNVIKILDFYRNIEKEMKFNKRILQELEDNYNPIETSNYEFNMHSKSSPTEEFALNIPEELSDRIKYIQEENLKLARLKAEILKEISSLNYTHKVIVYDFYLNNMKWVQISKQLNYSVRQCKNIRNVAIESLKDRFNKNKIIKEFNIPA